MNNNNDVKYCVSGTTGRKIAPYTSEYKPKPEKKMFITNKILKALGLPLAGRLLFNLCVILGIIGLALTMMSCSMPPACGDGLGEYNGVIAYHNGDDINSCDDRHWSSDGYMYGMKWQCVEYVRRYYYDVFDHAMPNRWGHAASYYDPTVENGHINKDRGLIQFKNGLEKPQVDDIIVWSGKYGHVAVITKVTDTHVHTIAQNVGSHCMSKYELDGNIIASGFGVKGLLRLPRKSKE
tara:strand:+ start:420 stop:1130 length:711 start_codon:yes stop_codon:yes gene_type:complete